MKLQYIVYTDIYIYILDPIDQCPWINNCLMVIGPLVTVVKVSPKVSCLPWGEHPTKLSQES